MDKDTKKMIGILLIVIIGFFIIKNFSKTGSIFGTDNNINDSWWDSLKRINISNFKIDWGKYDPNSTDNSSEAIINDTTNSSRTIITGGGGGGGGGGGSDPDPDPPAENVTNSTTPNYNNWTVSVTATNQLEYNQFGTHSAATDGYDAAYDNFTIFPQVGYVIMSLDSAYAVSIKNFENNSESWSFLISVPAAESTNITIDYTDLRSEVNVTFAWNTTSFDIRDNSTFSLGEGDTTINVSAVG